MERPAEWADWYNKSLESGGPQSQLSALLEEARHPDRRSQIAAQAANLIGQRLDPGTEPIEAAKRRGPPPDGLAARDLAAIAAMWFLSEKFGEPVTRNGREQTTVRHAMPCPSPCPEVEDKEKGYGYKNFARLWNNRARLIRKNPLLIMGVLIGSTKRKLSWHPICRQRLIVSTTRKGTHAIFGEY